MSQLGTIERCRTRFPELDMPFPGLFAKIVQLEQSGAALHLGLYQGRRKALIITAGKVVLSECMCHYGSETQNFGRVLSTDHHVSIIQLYVHGGLFIQHVVSTTCRRMSHNLPKVNYQLNISGRLFALGHRLHLAVQTHCCLGGQKQRVISLTQHVCENTLQKAGSISQNNEHEILSLTSETMHPTIHLDPVARRRADLFYFAQCGTFGIWIRLYFNFFGLL
ncbi:hypothetical protein BpHYR1_013227 [Brachionus plicatilis]|uniref:Uncharacterized protein n=1 Tax=Brachionus plicatilis TaxID=10195 RepID=A0A3M7RRV7_BRAPC|nr:hypothetical protein BpHYR1_013227 [Brachionus plicatilis]